MPLSLPSWNTHTRTHLSSHVTVSGLLPRASFLEEAVFLHSLYVLTPVMPPLTTSSRLLPPQNGNTWFKSSRKLLMWRLPIFSLMPKQETFSSFWPNFPSRGRPQCRSSWLSLSSPHLVFLTALSSFPPFSVPLVGAWHLSWPQIPISEDWVLGLLYCYHFFPGDSPLFS